MISVITMNAAGAAVIAGAWALAVAHAHQALTADRSNARAARASG